MTMIFHCNGHSAPVRSIGDAAAKWCALRAALRNGGIVTRNGQPVARISYNGRIQPLEQERGGGDVIHRATYALIIAVYGFLAFWCVVGVVMLANA